MRASQEAIRLTIYSETGGGRPPAKTISDELGRLAVGYGHVLRYKENFNLPMSTEKALDLLLRDFTLIETFLNKHLGLQSIAQHQYDAVVCWAYQAAQGRCGAAGQSYEDAHLLSHLAKGELQLVGAELDNWVLVSGRFSKRVAARRNREKFLFAYGHLPELEVPTGYRVAA